MGWSTVIGLAIVVTPLIGLAIYAMIDQRSARKDEKAATLAQIEQIKLMNKAVEERDDAVEMATKVEGELKLANAKIVELTATIARLKTAALLVAQGNIDGKTEDDLVADSHSVFGVPIVPNVPEAGSPATPTPGGRSAPTAALPPVRKP